MIARIIPLGAYCVGLGGVCSHGMAKFQTLKKFQGLKLAGKTPCFAAWF